MEIHTDQDKGYISVWLSNDEQKHCDRKALTARLLENASDRKCKVVYFLSGNDDLFNCIEGLMLNNLRISKEQSTIKSNQL